jgi:hypothetical protein
MFLKITESLPGNNDINKLYIEQGYIIIGFCYYLWNMNLNLGMYEIIFLN